MSRWWTEPHALAVAPAGGVTEASARIGAVLDGVHAALDRARLPRGRRVRCVLRDDLVRYRVLPWHARLSLGAARQALARQCFVETYGEAARGWRMSVDTPRHGRSSLACAADAELLDGLAHALSERGLRTAGVEPLLMQHFNGDRRGLPAGDLWYALRHGGGLTLLLLQGGEPGHVRQLALPTTLADPSSREPQVDAEVDRLIDREAFALGLDAAAARRHAAVAVEAP